LRRSSLARLPLKGARLLPARLRKWLRSRLGSKLHLHRRHFSPGAPATQRSLGPQARIAFIFDDASPTVYEHRMLFANRGVPICIAIDGSSMVEERHLAWAQVRELLDVHGWTASNHGNCHARLSELTLRETREEVHEMHQQMLNHGVTPCHYVYPYGVVGTDKQRSVIPSSTPVPSEQAVHSSRMKTPTCCTDVVSRTGNRCPLFWRKSTRRISEKLPWSSTHTTS